MSFTNIPQTRLPLKPLEPQLIKLIWEDLKFHFGIKPDFPPQLAVNDPLRRLEEEKIETLSIEDMCRVATHYFLNVIHSPPHFHSVPKTRLRAGLAICLTFLRHNGIILNAKEMELFQMVLDIAYAEASEEEFCDFLLDHVHTPNLSPLWIRNHD